MPHVSAITAVTANSAAGIAQSSVKRRLELRPLDVVEVVVFFGIYSRESVGREFHHKGIRSAIALLGAANHAAAVRQPMGAGA